jgi:hypothetical protein
MSVSLWTFQSAAIAPILGQQRYYASWEHTPHNWRIAYDWMAAQMYAALSLDGTAPPVWCWHSCEGRIGAPPTYETAAALMATHEMERGIVTVELAVPERMMMLFFLLCLESLHRLMSRGLRASLQSSLACVSFSATAAQA